MTRCSRMSGGVGEGPFGPGDVVLGRGGVVSRQSPAMRPCAEATPFITLGSPICRIISEARDILRADAATPGPGPRW